MSGCGGRPSDELLQAIEEFNEGEWFDCHETLEDLWVGQKGELRDFYQGLLQVAVALHHWRNGNFGGALSLLERGTGYLSRAGAVCLGVDVAGVVTGALRFREALAGLGESQMWEVDRELVPVLRLKREP